MAVDNLDDISQPKTEGESKRKFNPKSMIGNAASNAKRYVSKDNGEESPDGSSPSTSKREKKVSFGRKPQRTFCSRCNQENMTITKHVIGRSTVIAAVVAFFVVPGVGAAFVIKSNMFKDVEHKCCVCKRKLGRKKKLPC